MMQEDFGIGVSEGAWLASANYLGYLFGALAAMKGKGTQRFAIRCGLVTIALATLAMAAATDLTTWIALRALSGFASAWVLVNVSAWSLDQLGKAGRSDLGGIVYAGVGAGIVFSGLACLGLSQAHLPSPDAWLALGATAVVATVGLWGIAGSGETRLAATQTIQAGPSDIPEFWRIVFCAGAFGLGYIIPATFLPVMAKRIVSDPAWFGWAWPVFGLAAVVSTLVAARLTRRLTNRGVWVLGNVVMALGVLVPLLVPGLMGIVVAALFVGGTFMVNTMASMQEARRVAGAQAKLLMAAMTSAFAVGQILGPVLVTMFMHLEEGFAVALIASAIPLLLAAYTLFMHRSAMMHSPGTTR